jgi:hypothetical protein
LTRHRFRRMKIVVFFAAALLLVLISVPRIFPIEVSPYVILGLLSSSFILAVFFFGLKRLLHAEKA